MKVADDIHRVDGVRGANVYLVVTPADGLLMVDTGLPGNAQRIVDFVRGIGHEPSDVRIIVITHADPDHMGSVADLKDLTGADVAIHAEDAPALADERPSKQVKGALGVAFRAIGAMGLMRMSPLQADRLLLEGDRVDGFRVVETPGHTAGSISLVRGDGVVFSGDALLSDGQGKARPPRKVLTDDMDQALASVGKIYGLEPSLLLPGHGEPVVRPRARTA